MQPIKVAEGRFTPHMFEHHYFRVYLANNPEDVSKVENIDKEFIHQDGTIPGLGCNIYVVHFAQDSSG